MPKIFVTRRAPESAIALLHEAFGAENVSIYPEDRPIPREVLLEGVKGADAILSMLTEPMNAEVFDAAGPIGNPRRIGPPPAIVLAGSPTVQLYSTAGGLVTA